MMRSHSVRISNQGWKVSSNASSGRTQWSDALLCRQGSCAKHLSIRRLKNINKILSWTLQSQMSMTRRTRRNSFSKKTKDVRRRGRIASWDHGRLDQATTSLLGIVNRRVVKKENRFRNWVHWRSPNTVAMILISAVRWRRDATRGDTRRDLIRRITRRTRKENQEGQYHFSWMICGNDNRNVWTSCCCWRKLQDRDEESWQKGGRWASQVGCCNKRQDDTRYTIHKCFKINLYRIFKRGISESQ